MPPCSIYDGTELRSPVLITLDVLNPDLTSLRIDYCGRLEATLLPQIDLTPAPEGLHPSSSFLFFPPTCSTFSKYDAHLFSNASINNLVSPDFIVSIVELSLPALEEDALV
jgi:hypothetical protein